MDLNNQPTLTSTFLYFFKLFVSPNPAPDPAGFSSKILLRPAPAGLEEVKSGATLTLIQSVSGTKQTEAINNEL